MRILVTREIHPDAVASLQQRHEVEYHSCNRPLDPTYLAEALPGFDAVLSSVSEKIDGAMVRAAAPRLKAISNMASGLDNIDVQAARAAGIQVFNVPETTIDATADHTLAVALALIRKVIPSQEFIKAGVWRSWDPTIFLGRTLAGMTWGIFGAGRIGQAVARRAFGFGCLVTYFEPGSTICPTIEAMGGRKETWEAFLAGSDILSIHAPLTESTRGLFDAGTFAAMKPGSYLINMGRGPIVVMSDLLSALSEGRLAGTGLDVFDPEPLPSDHPILALPNIVATPHIGTATQECRRLMAVTAARNLNDFFDGAPREQ